MLITASKTFVQPLPNGLITASKTFKKCIIYIDKYKVVREKNHTPPMKEICAV